MVTLKNYQMEVAKLFAKYRNNPLIFDNSYDNIPRPFTLDDARAYIATQLKTIPAQRKLIYWNDQFVGEIGITLMQDVFRFSAEMGYFIAEPFWGKGIATEAVRLMTKYTFENFNIVRIEAGVFEFNKPSMRVLEKNNFYLESIKRKAAFKNGKIIDDYLWVRLGTINSKL